MIYSTCSRCLGICGCLFVDPPPYTISGCGTDTITVTSKYEYGAHLHWVCKFIRRVEY